FRSFWRPVLGSGAQRIWTASAQSVRDQLSVRRNDVDLHALQLNLVPDVDNGPFRPADTFVGVLPTLIRRLAEVATIEAPVNGDQLCERLKPTGMVGVKVTEDEVVDLLEAGLLRHSGDPLGVTVAGLPARVVEQRFAGWRHHERGGASLHVYPVNVEVSGLCGEGPKRSNQERNEPDGSLHAGMLPPPRRP